MNLNEIDLNDLDFSNMGSWPVVVRVLLAVLLFVGVIFGGYYLVIKDQILQLEQVAKKEIELKQTYEIKQERAANLEAYQQQMKIMEESFGTLLRQLPKKTEVPGLLEDISYVGSTSGLDFSEISLQDEIEEEFYAVLPIKIEVSGSFHQLGEFVSKVAALPRIVTLHDFRINAQIGKEGANEERLAMSITAKTYRYEGAEVAP